MLQSHSSTRRRATVVAAGIAVSALALTGCGSGGAAGGGDTITIGTTDKVTSLDPAAAYDNGSLAVMSQVYMTLMALPPGGDTVEPYAAESAEFTAPDTYTVKLLPDLTFANGHALTSSDVKFSFDRQFTIDDPNGPVSLLANLESTEVVDDLTVDFKLKSPDDVTFAQVLTSIAGMIVDEEVLAADAVTPDATIVDGNAFAGQYAITSFALNELIEYTAFEGYKGPLGPATTPTVLAQYYTDTANLKLDIQQGNIDVAFRSLSSTDVADLRTNDAVTVHEGPGGELRYMVFNFDTMPFGAKTAEADPAKALAVRQAMADVIDRAAISENVYAGTYTPLYSFVPTGLPGANDSLKGLYGDKNGGPDAEAAKARLAAAGITEPVTLNIQYSNDHYGPSSADEYAQVKDQLEATGLFTVNLQTTEWTQYSDDRVTDVYPIYQLGWFPDYSDADTYLTPFFIKDNFLVNHYENPEVESLILAQKTEQDEAKRLEMIGQIQDLEAKDLSTLPILQGSQIAVAKTDITGVTLDASFTFRYGSLGRG